LRYDRLRQRAGLDPGGAPVPGRQLGMSDPVALALIAGIVTLGTAFLGAWGRRQTAPFGTDQLAAASSVGHIATEA
jgi:hypothetical protein